MIHSGAFTGKITNNIGFSKILHGNNHDIYMILFRQTFQKVESFDVAVDAVD